MLSALKSKKEADGSQGKVRVPPSRYKGSSAPFLKYNFDLFGAKGDLINRGQEDEPHFATKHEQKGTWPKKGATALEFEMTLALIRFNVEV